jgi:hypothetical protein
MDLDKITDIELLRNMLKNHMVCIKEDIKTPTHLYKKGEWYFYVQDDDGVFLYLNDYTCGLQLTYDEAKEFLK